MGRSLRSGDTVVFFYAPTGGPDPGFYGWAVILDWFEDSSSPLRFRPVAPSDHLKMDPWWDDNAALLADKIRGKVKQGTLWIVADALVGDVRNGIARWLARHAIPKP